MLDELRLDTVRYSFLVNDGLDPGWHVRSVHWIEGLSQTFEIVVDLITVDVTVNSDVLLGASVELLVVRGDLAHGGFGIVHRVDDLGVTTERLSVRVYVVPAFRLLDQRIDTRIFQGLTVPEILEEVLTPALAEYGREADFSGALTGQYEARDCCVQFRESDFNFCCRLMEEEGIAYYFEPDDENGRERLVLVDNNDCYGSVALMVGDEIPMIPERFEEADRESLQYFELTRTERINKLTTRGFNWKAPTALDQSSQGEADERGRTRELYLFDDRRQIVDDPIDDPRATSFDGTGLPQREPQAIHRFEREVATVCQCEGKSNVTGLMPGRRFFLGEHHRNDLSAHEFLVTRVKHQADVADVEIGGALEAASYKNELACIPIEQTFRPPIRTPKPRVYGAQTAIVMGPADDSEEDIHTDPHGRIKVRFHWDRISPADETASCWVRVAQTWAGRGWGSMFIPRVGMEVVVDFLDGDPDRPLVVGCVYNGDQTPPYSLPEEKTKSTIKSDSSPGGGGFNELRFEDAKGSEEVFLHAQKDLVEKILNKHSTSVAADQSNSVGGDQTNSVTGDQTETVSGKQTMTVEKNRSVTIHGSQSVTIKGGAAEDGVSGSKLNVTGDWKADASNTIEIQAPTHIKLTCGGSTIEMTPGKITLSAGGSAKLVLDAKALMQSAAGSKVLLDGGALTQSKGGAKLKLDGNALTQSKGGSKVLLDGNALMSSPGTGTVQAPTATLAGGGGSVEAGGAGVTCAGGQVNVSGGMVNIAGGMVAIN